MQKSLFDPARPPTSFSMPSPAEPNRTASEVPEDAGFWDDAPVISRYTRDRAIKDGVLVDVTETAREAGFKHPLALTAAVHADIKDITPSKRGIQDEEGRLWDLLWMGRHAVSAAAACRQTGPVFLSFVMPVGRHRNYRAKIVLGPGDAGEPVFTVMTPEED